MRWLAALGTFAILFGLLMVLTYAWLVPAYGINVATVICFIAGMPIGWVSCMAWQAVDLWEQGY